MRRSTDKISHRILDIVNKSEEPLETQEILLLCKDTTRVMLIYRLTQLRGDGLIKGKTIGCGKGTWIWWRMIQGEGK